MVRTGLMLGLLGTLAGLLSSHEDAQKPTPVLVELFTSEGCSSCPPADALLEELDRLQPVAGVQAIVLSEHVDYWDQLGWRDPFSSALVSARQSDYALRFRLDSPYTPQIVIDGGVQVLGSDGAAVRKALVREAAARRSAIRILEARRDGVDVAVRLAVDPLAADAHFSRADVWVAVVTERETSRVLKGENSGRTLNHVAVVRQLLRAGKVSKAQGYTSEVRFPRASSPGVMRAIAFLQQPGAGPVEGVAVAPALQ